MTCKDKLMQEHPAYVGTRFIGGCHGCPDDYGYADEPEWCALGNVTCTECWNREVPKPTNFEYIKKKVADLTVSELAYQLSRLCYNAETCAHCPFYVDCAESEEVYMWENWLQRKVKED